MSRRQGQELKPVPEIIVNGNIVYKRGSYLGKGGFARCYEVVNKSNLYRYACKAIAKSTLLKPSNKEKVAQEIDIQKGLSHENVVKIYDYFESDDNVFLMLELCSNKSLMEMQRRRSTVTEPEARYLLRQITAAVAYLHAKLIIHRDLKLGNIFLNDQMVCKIGDFGLATRLKDREERRDTLCGTPNYIAPEILQRKRHSFEVDIWALGCILYTLLIGRPPFETTQIKETYERIKKNIYTVPTSIGIHAASLIKQMLAHNCKNRPKAEDVLKYPFFTQGFALESLPTSALSIEPRINTNLLSGGVAAIMQPDENQLPASPKIPLSKPMPQDAASMIVQTKRVDLNQARKMVHVLSTQVLGLIEKLKVSSKNSPVDILASHPDTEAESPNYTPNYFIDKWVDYTDKYGLGVALNDGTVSIDFNDGVKISVNRSKTRYVFTSADGLEHYFPNSQMLLSFPVADISKKHTLLEYFISYMNMQLASASNQGPPIGTDISRPPYIYSWVRTRVAMALYLSNGTTQINYFNDHLKLIFDPTVQSISVLSSDRVIHTYSYKTLLENGVSDALLQRIIFSSAILEHLVTRVENPSSKSKQLTAFL